MTDHSTENHEDPSRDDPSRIASVPGNSPRDGRKPLPQLDEKSRQAIADLAAPDPQAHRTRWQIFQSLPPQSRWPYFRRVFLPWIIIAASLLVVIALLVSTVARKPVQPWLQVQGINMSASPTASRAAMGSLRDGFRKGSGIPADRVRISAGMRFPRTKAEQGDQAFAGDVVKMEMQVGAGDINAIITTSDTVHALAQAGFVTPVSKVLTSAQTQRLSPDLLDSRGRPIHGNDNADDDKDAAGNGNSSGQSQKGKKGKTGKAMAISLEHSAAWSAALRTAGITDATSRQRMVLVFSSIRGQTRWPRELVDYLY